MINLLIKGTESSAVAAANRFGIALTDIKEVRSVIGGQKGYKEINIHVKAKTHNDTLNQNKLDRWFRADTTPFPQGTLLLWSEERENNA